ncbi:hypothetical protein [Sphingomonas pokkalii]|nr:hypothetical protein [Sphingomonas pokkalii]
MNPTHDLPENSVTEENSANPSEMSELMRAHLDMVEGGAASFSAWYSNP